MSPTIRKTLNTIPNLAPADGDELPSVLVVMGLVFDDELSIAPESAALSSISRMPQVGPLNPSGHLHTISPEATSPPP
jgi:hypothetical protein